MLTLAGGSAMPNSLAGTAQYLESFHKLWDAGRAAGAVGVLSTHPFMHGAIDKLEAMLALAVGNVRESAARIESDAEQRARELEAKMKAAE